MEFGISTACFYPLEIEKALEQVVQNNIPVAELFINAPSELNSQFTKMYQRILQNGNTKVVSIHPFTSGSEPMLLFSNYERRAIDAVEGYKSYFELCANLSAKYVVLHGGLSQGDLDYTFYAERYAMLDDCAKTFGVRVAHENVCRNVGCKPEFFSEIQKYLPQIQFVLDIKQAKRCGYCVYDFMQAMGRQICHLHISDNDEQNDCLPVGYGNFDFAVFFKKLKDQEVDCSAVVELYSTGYEKTVDLWRSVQNLTNYV